MSVFIPKGSKSFVYDFWLNGTHYKKSTGQTDRALAEKVERDLKAALRKAKAGVVDSPRFSEWAGVYYTYVLDEQQLRAPQAIDDVLRVLLRFCGARPDGTNPKNPVVEGEPYLDLRLRDFIDRPELILQMEDWMATRGISRTTKHHYRTYMSRMYKVAMLPQYRATTGVQMNPFAGIPRGKKVTRKVALRVDQIVAALGQMSYHVRLALAIAALAPKLRLENVLSLRFDDHLDPAFRWITLHDHKTIGETGTAAVAPVPAQLRVILLEAKQRAAPRCPFVVQYRGRRVKRIRAGVKAGFERAGIPYGRGLSDGATFHTIRHSLSTLIPQLGINAWAHQGLMGWSNIQTAQIYTHLAPTHLQGPAEQLSEAVQIAGVVNAPGQRPRQLAGGQSVGLAQGHDLKPTESRVIPNTLKKQPGRQFVRKAR